MFEIPWRRMAVICPVFLMPCLALGGMWETPEQCEKRYGTNVWERHIGAGFEMIRVYEKENSVKYPEDVPMQYKGNKILVVIAFVRQPDDRVLASVVLYGKFDNQFTEGGERNFVDSEIRSLMAMTPGQWKPFEEPEKRMSSRRAVKAKQSMMIQRAGEVFRAFSAELAGGPYGLHRFGGNRDYYNGKDAYALLRGGYVFVVSDVAIKAVKDWVPPAKREGDAAKEEEPEKDQ